MLGCFDAVLVALARRLALPVATADRLLLTACGADALPSGRHGWTPSPGHDPPRVCRSPATTARRTARASRPYCPLLPPPLLPPPLLATLPPH